MAYTNLQKWIDEQSAPTIDDYITFHNLLARDQGCSVCPIPEKCPFESDVVCQENLRKFALEEVK